MQFKTKIINDPVYGFITIHSLIIYKLIEHPYFQRLRNIKQLGLSNYVYPGANHTRFHHALGAYHLVTQAIHILKNKNIEISNDEAEGLQIAVLLHDIGHAPFSHTLEHVLFENISHEDVSLKIMHLLNETFSGSLSTAIAIFTNQYHRPFLHQLVSSQLDVDRLDYLTRDSFYTGVAEGVIGYNRIINMLNVVDNNLVVEEKGINSIEKFLTSRRLMYWQVYLHKTVISAENMLVNILQRAKFLNQNNLLEFCTPNLKNILAKSSSKNNIDELLNYYLQLDDNEIYTNIKYWQYSTDKCLQILCTKLCNRKLFKLSMQDEPFSDAYITEIINNMQQDLGLSDAEIPYVFINNSISNYAYKIENGQINILQQNGKIIDVLSLLTHLNLPEFTKPKTKYFISIK